MGPKYLLQEGPEEWGLSRPPALTSPAESWSLCLQGVFAMGPRGLQSRNELEILSFLRDRKSKEEISVHWPRL